MRESRYCHIVSKVPNGTPRTNPTAQADHSQRDQTFTFGQRMLAPGRKYYMLHLLDRSFGERS